MEQHGPQRKARHLVAPKEHPDQALLPRYLRTVKNISLIKKKANTMKNTIILPMNRLGAPASRRPVGNRKPELAGETPALPETAPRVMGSKRENAFGETSP